MSVRNKVVVALAIVLLAGQGCVDIGSVNLDSLAGNPDDGCCGSGGLGYYSPVLQRMFFGRSADSTSADWMSADTISADTIVARGIDTLRLYAFSNYASLYRPAGLQVTVGDGNVAAVQVFDSILPIRLTIRALAPGVTTLTASAEGQSITAALIVKDSL